jgi:predicted NUDIX family NTP pyrophosphohydrolase
LDRQRPINTTPLKILNPFYSSDKLSYKRFQDKMKKSAGILPYRLNDHSPEFFLVHPGGPFWKNKDAGAWSIPKGEFADDEDPLEAAKREFKEETGMDCKGNFLALEPLKQKSGKLVFAWAILKDIDPGSIRSNTFKMEWPPKSGKMVDIPEIDKGGWFGYGQAKEKIIAGQAGFLDQLILKINFQIR